MTNTEGPAATSCLKSTPKISAIDSHTTPVNRIAITSMVSASASKGRRETNGMRAVACLSHTAKALPATIRPIQYARRGSSGASPVWKAPARARKAPTNTEMPMLRPQRLFQNAIHEAPRAPRFRSRTSDPG